jgi:hypothetical protein
VRLVTRIVARLVVNYFAYVARLGASARRVAHRFSSTTSPTPRDRVPRHVARLVAWLVVDYFASRRLVVDYFASAVRPGASARRADHRADRRRLLRLSQARRQQLRLAQVRRRLLRLTQARRRLLRLAQTRRRILRLRRASGCLGASRGS